MSISRAPEDAIMLALLRRFTDRDKTVPQQQHGPDKFAPKPMAGQVDFDAIRDDIIAHFGKTISYLAK
jgi:hypothetical protein